MIVPHGRERAARITLALLLALLLALGNAPYFAGAQIVERDLYTVGEPVPLSIPSTSEPIRIVIDAPDGRFRMLDADPAPFVPRAAGNHTITLLTVDGTQIDQDSFIAIASQEPSAPRDGTVAIRISDDPRADEPVLILLAPRPTGPVDVTIRGPGGAFRYSGPWSDAPFTPKSAGPHEIIILQDGRPIGQLSFVVGPTREPTATNTTTPVPIEQESIQPERSGTVATGTVDISERDSDGRAASRQAHLLRKRTSTDGDRYDVELTPNPRVARRMVIHDLKLGTSMQTGIDEVPVDTIRETRLRRTGPVLKAYAIDLGGLDFSEALVTGIAQGTELHKCALWDYSTQTCRGTWVKVMDLVPGQEYTITLTPGDPGYAETGVATVNSRKPIYLPNETVELLMVVLDTEGFLVNNAEITLTITGPGGANTTFTTAAEQIEQIGDGVYRAYYPYTADEGNYTLIVDAIAPGVHSVMGSLFAVMANYPFDILRDAPVTTDPFKGPFNASITVVPRIEVEEYELTEVLPAEFGIVEATGAAISGDSASTYLTWSGLSGNTTVAYSAQPPRAAPALFALGKAFITYVQDSVVRVFEELRAWFLAIDPEVTREQGLVVYGDRSPDGSVKFRNWTGILADEQDSGLDMGDRSTWFRFRCLKARAECLLVASDGGNDLNFAVFDTSTWLWRNYTQLDANIGQDDQLQFDVECEDSSGDCLIAYEDATTGNNNFAIRTWNATGLSGVTSVTVPGGESNDFQWLELYPHKGTDRIGIAMQNDGGGANTDTPAIYAAIWNGTAMADWGNLTTTAPAQGNGRTFFKHYDCGWEGGTGNFLCFYGEEGLNGVEANRWNTTAWVNLGTIYGATGDEVLEVAVCGQEPWSNFTHNTLGVFFCDDAADLDGAVWNGTALNKTATAETPAVNTNAECGSNKATNEWGRNMECRWERSGDQAIFTWVAGSGQDWITAGTYTRSTTAWSMSAWNTGTQIVADAAGDIRMVQLSPNQADDTLFLVYADGTSDGGCSDWTGTAWDGTGCNSQLVFETGGARPARQWITFDWFRTPPPQPDITIYRPDGTGSLVNYSGILNPSSTSVMAENLTTTAQPPTGTSAPLPGTEVPSAAYVNVSASDDTRRSTVISGAGGLRATQIFNFSVTDSAISMEELLLVHEGRATQAVAQNNGNFRIYVYNWTSDAYVLERTVFASATDTLSEITITAGFTDYIRNRQMLVMVQGEFATGAGGNARAEVMTDYIGLSTSSRAVLRANVTVNASAVDDDGISFCQWAMINLTGSQIGSFSPLPLNSAPYYVNINDTTLWADGEYQLTVFCNDTLANRRNQSERVRVDNTAPLITVYTLVNQTNLSVSSAIFSWNVTDIFGENMICNVTIDTTVAASSVIAPHGENTTRNITSIADGPHNWTVTCVDDAGNRNTSAAPRSFIVDTRPPNLTIILPAAASYVNTSTVNFTYTPADANGLANCTLTLDNVNNMTTVSPASGTTTNFTIPGVNEGLHRWNVTCYDTFFKSNISATRNFTVDVTPPVIYLNTTNGLVFNNTIPALNFTAFDNIDANMTCNITVNGTVVASNIGGPNGTLVSTSVDLDDGDKAWNVTCVDDAGNYNTSQTRFFRVVGGPLVSLQRPNNGTVSSGLNVNFTYFAQDGDGIVNCTLIVDSLANQTNTTITNGANNSFFVTNISPAGIHTWYVNCTDTAGVVGDSVPRTIIVDRTAPNIVLSLPSAGQVLTVTPTLLNFTMTDDFSPNATCNLTIDGAVIAANQNFIAVNASLTTRTQTIINGLHYWNVTCVDQGGNSNISLTRNFTVNATFPLTVTVAADKELYQEGETARLNITVRNASSIGIASNGTFDLIYTNNTATDVSWWNVSWARRKPISINETSNVARTNKPVAVNVTGLFGAISNCQNEIRVVRDSDLVEMAFNVMQGDDVTFCYIQFNASVAANQNNQQDYHVYYNNSGAANPAYINLTAPVVIFSDDFADAGVAGWTADAGWDRDTGNPLAGGHAHVDGSVTNVSIRPASVLDTAGYDTVNITFSWALNGNWDAGEYIRFEISNDSGSVYGPNQSLLAGGAGAISNSQTISLNASYKVSTFLFRFRATTDNANEDGGFDNIAVTGYNFLQNVSAWAGEVQVHINRTNSTVNASGNTTANVTTLGRLQGNYSAVARFTHPLGTHSPGTGWDWFRIVSDVFGPEVSLVDPANGSTNHSGQIRFVYLANDVANDVANCTIIIDGLINGTNATPINETANNTYNATLSEGRHTWQVNCTDILGNNGSSNISVFFLDDTAPNVTILYPNSTVLGSPNVTFSFNATDNLDLIIACVINLSGPSPRNISVNATNATNATGIGTNLSDGAYAWNVTCRDNINNTFTTGIANFSIDRSPIVQLFSPADDYGVNATGIILLYNVTESSITNCTLFINGSFNQSNTSALPFTNNDGNDNFTLTGLPYGRYNWSVTCWDTNGFNGSGSTWRFQLDNDIPNVTLNTPTQNQTLFATTVVFNWTVIDTDPSPTCNLTLDGTINQSNIASNESVPTRRSVTGLAAGNHTWFVTCWDGAGFSNATGTQNFTIDGTVRVTLNNPENNSIDGDGIVAFSYTPESVSGFTLGFCDLYLDGISNSTHIGLTSGSQDTFNINGIPDGSHYWYVNCTDSVGGIGVSVSRNFTTDLQDPVVAAHAPNGTTFNVNSVTFNWTATDNLDLNLTCSVRVNGTLQSPGSLNSPNNTVTNATYSGFTDGLFLWNVTCYDDGARNGTSGQRNFTIEAPPTVVLNAPAVGNRTRNQTVVFRYTPDDNSNAIANCTIEIDGSGVLTNTTVTEGAQGNFTVSGISEGFHLWNITCADPRNNLGANVSGRNFTIDLTPPSITINAPFNDTAIGGNNATLNWTPIDTSSLTATCNVSVTNGTGSLNRTGIGGSNGTSFTWIFTDLGEGPHNWSVTCVDDVGNENSTSVYTFYVNQPDLYTNDSRFTINSSNPALGDSSLLRLNVTNIGGVAANGFIVSFWDGLPGIGVFIGNATGTLVGNASSVLNVSWNITAGYHSIWAVVDPANVIGELNESNNNATLTISAIVANITYPPNATVTSDNTSEIHFNITDFAGGSIDYAIFVDGTANGQTGTVADGSNTSLSIAPALSDGYRRIIVQATDTLGRSRNSTARTIIVDTTAPSGAFLTVNGTYFPSGTLNVTVRVNDTLDADINISIFVNGTQNVSTNVTNASATNITLTGLAEGFYNLTIQSIDHAGNAANSSNIIIIVDSTPPTVTPVDPPDAAPFSVRAVNITYNVTDNLDPILACFVTLDGSQVDGANVTSGANRTYQVTSLVEGTHLWNATCWDGNNAVGQINNLAISSTRSFTVSIAPNITLLSPANATITNQSNRSFTFNVTDETGLTNCSIIIDGIVNQTRTTAQLTLNGTNEFNVTGLNNTVLWAITCFDSSVGLAQATSQTRTIYVDLVAPTPIINTASDLWFNTSSPTMNLTVTDNFDVVLNWTFFVDGLANANGSVVNGSSTTTSLINVADGNHSVVLQAYDDAGNYANSSSIIIYVDTQAPVVTLLSPENASNLSTTIAFLNFTVADNLASALICNLTLDGSVVQQYNLTNGTTGNYTSGSLATGNHYWNVTCIDNATNRGVSATFGFFVQLPDLTITSGNITASNLTPVENQTIEINATIFNIGQLNASNVTIQFWLGDPDLGGVQLGQNQTVSVLGIGQNVTLTINYTTIVGLNRIFVVVDPPTPSGGFINESNETNNRASLAILVGVYQVFAGGSQNELRIADNALIAAFTWNETEVTGSNVFVADTDSAITFTSLMAIGRNSTNGTAVGTNDFDEIDNRLGTGGLNESINNTWTNGGQPHLLENLTLFGRPVIDIPMVNSTITASFRTGILWDRADGGAAYNGSQDIVFMTVMNQSQAGQYGTYDYEIKVPSPLRDYIVGGGTVTFYAEIK